MPIKYQLLREIMLLLLFIALPTPTHLSLKARLIKEEISSLSRKPPQVFGATANDGSEAESQSGPFDSPRKSSVGYVLKYRIYF